MELGTELRVEVSDSGPGIPESQQGRIFEEYVQLANPGRQRHRGAGLGLAIVRRIDSLLGLRLAVASALGSGSTFSFYLPRASATEVVPAAGLAHDRFDRLSFMRKRVGTGRRSYSSRRSSRATFGLGRSRARTYAEAAALLDDLKRASTLPNWILTDDMLGSALSGLETAQILSREYGFGNGCHASLLAIRILRG